MTIENILNEFAVSFTKIIYPEYYFTVQLEFTDISDKNIWQLDIKNKNVIIYDKALIRPEETFLLTVKTLEKLYNNELSSLTAFLQGSNEKGVMCSLIDIKNKKEENRFWDGDKLEQEKLDFFSRSHIFSSEFFSKFYPTKVIVDSKYSINHNDVDAIGLYSDFKNGTLHVYFSIKTNEVLNYPPNDCGIFVLHGNGKLKLDGNEYDIQANEYYHLMPQKSISFKNNEDISLEIIFMGNAKRYKNKYKTR
jgi:mannose-6-phosphate isomerase-like protein (cupin superfamily)